MLVFLTVLASVANTPQTQPAQKDDPIICKRDAAGSEVGTHMRPKKVCMKKSDWDFAELQKKQTLDSANNSGNTNPGLIPLSSPR